jgi:predicted ester cyclase
MPTSDNNSTTVARRFVDAINDRCLDRFDTVFATDAKLTFSGNTMPCDPPAARTLAEGWLAVFPDWHIELLDAVAQGGTVAVRLRWTGTQSAPVLDLPVTGRQVHVDEMLFFEVIDGLIVDGWEVWDEATMRRQLTELRPEQPGPVIPGRSS